MYFLGSSDKEVALISSYVDNTLMCDHQWDIRKNHYKDVSDKKEPYISHLYNKFKCGVDRRNLSVIKYRTKFRNVKWWRTIFDRMFETAVLNAFIIYRSFYPEKCKDGAHKEFRQMLMYELSESYQRYKRQLEPPKGISQMMMVQKMMLDKHRQPPIFVQREKVVKRKHTVLIGAQAHCEECSRLTRYVCQECTWQHESLGHSKHVGVCSDFCMKLHRYGPLLKPPQRHFYRTQLRNKVAHIMGYDDKQDDHLDEYPVKNEDPHFDKLEDNDNWTEKRNQEEELFQQHRSHYHHQLQQQLHQDEHDYWNQPDQEPHSKHEESP